MSRALSCLSTRMQEILSEVPKNLPEGAVLCDVGCDHGMLGCALLEREPGARVLFSDVSADCLEKAKHLAEILDLNARASFFVSNGFAHLTPPAADFSAPADPSASSASFSTPADPSAKVVSFSAPVDVAVIAGMGGREIASILLAAPNSAKLYVLQPMKNAPELREAIAPAGFEILTDRKITENHRIHDLLKVRYVGKPCPLTEKEIKYGKTNLISPNPAFVYWVTRRKGMYQSLLARDVTEETHRRASAELAELNTLNLEEV